MQEHLGGEGHKATSLTSGLWDSCCQSRLRGVQPFDWNVTLWSTNMLGHIHRYPGMHGAGGLQVEHVC